MEKEKSNLWEILYVFKCNCNSKWVIGNLWSGAHRATKTVYYGPVAYGYQKPKI